MKKQKDNRFEYNSLIVFSLSMIANVLGMIFQALVGRLLNDVSLFADLQSIMSLFNILVLPTTVASGVVTRYTAQFYSRNEYSLIKDFLRKAFMVLGLLSIIYIFIMLNLKSGIAEWLHIDDLLIVVVAVFLSGLATLTAIYVGGLQGLQLFVLYGLYGLIGPIFKIIAVFVSVEQNNQLVTILIIWILGLIISYIIGTFFLTYSLKDYSCCKCSINHKEITNYIYNVFIANVGFTLLSNIDMLLVKHNYNSVAGDYSAALMLGKIVTYVTGALVIVLFPMVAGEGKTEKYKLELLKKTIICNILLGVIVLALLNIFSSLFIHMLLGSAFTACADYIFPISVYVLPQGIINILVTYSMANNEMNFITKTLLVGILLECITTIVGDFSLVAFIWNISLIAWIIVLINFIHIFKGKTIYSKVERRNGI